MGSAKEFLPPARGRIEHLSVSPDAELELKFDRAIEVILIALIAFVPWPLGSVHPWAQEIVIAAAALLALVFAAKVLLIRRVRLVRSWSYLPIALFCSLAVVQLIPLPHAVLRVISSSTLQIKSRLLAGLPASANAPMSLTFYAGATLLNLRLLLAVVVIFCVALNFLRTRGRIRRMLLAIAAVGGLVILLALAQDVTGTHKVYWSIVKRIPLAAGGPFVGHNDFPLFANLTIGSAVALLLLMRADHRSSRLAHSPMPPWRLTGACTLFAIIALGTIADFWSLSRSGVIALGIASVCIGIVAAIRWRLGLERSMIAFCLMVCFAVSFYFASDAVNHRLATLEHPFEQYNSRWLILKDILAAWPRFPLFGTGLGTHEFVYPMFQRFLETTNFDHAENEFAQMLEETGAVGLAIVLGFVGVITAGFFRTAWRSSRSSTATAVFGLGFGLLAATVQSFSGFGEHVPANAVLTAVVCALLLSIGRIVQHQAEPSPGKTPHSHAAATGSSGTPFILKLAGALAVMAAFVPALLGADRARRAEAAWDPAGEALLNATGNLGTFTGDQLQDYTAAAQMAHQAEPDNVKYLYWMTHFKWETVERRHDPNADEDVRPSDETARIRVFVDQLERCRQICPTYSPAILLDGQLRYLALDQPQGVELIQLAATVAPTNLNVFLQLAAIDCDHGDFAAAMEAFRHYLSLEGQQQGSFSTAAQLLVHAFKHPDLAMQLAGDNPQRQLAVVSALREENDRADYQAMASAIEVRAKAARRAELIAECSGGQAAADDLAQLAKIYASEHDLNDAIDCYQRALAKQYDAMNWHLALAKALLSAGRKQEALDEASICLARQPHWADAEQLIAEADAEGVTTDKP